MYMTVPSPVAEYVMADPNFSTALDIRTCTARIPIVQECNIYTSSGKSEPGMQIGSGVSQLSSPGMRGLPEPSSSFPLRLPSFLATDASPKSTVTDSAEQGYAIEAVTFHVTTDVLASSSSQPITTTPTANVSTSGMSSGSTSPTISVSGSGVGSSDPASISSASSSTTSRISSQTSRETDIGNTTTTSERLRSASPSLTSLKTILSVSSSDTAIFSQDPISVVSEASTTASSSSTLLTIAPSGSNNSSTEIFSSDTTNT